MAQPNLSAIAKRRMGVWLTYVAVGALLALPITFVMAS